jgi:hypothetical protein
LRLSADRIVALVVGIPLLAVLAIQISALTERATGGPRACMWLVCLTGQGRARIIGLEVRNQ